VYRHTPTVANIEKFASEQLFFCVCRRRPYHVPSVILPRCVEHVKVHCMLTLCPSCKLTSLVLILCKRLGFAICLLNRRTEPIEACRCNIPYLVV
jgi:hypothetical protein